MGVLDSGLFLLQMVSHSRLCVAQSVVNTIIFSFLNVIQLLNCMAYIVPRSP